MFDTAPGSDLETCLDAHVEHLWQALPDQSRKRLQTLAVSAGVAVTPEAHAELAGALEMIAEAEGTLEEETFFAPYLGVEKYARWAARRPEERDGSVVAHRPEDGTGQAAARRREKRDVGAESGAGCRATRRRKDRGEERLEAVRNKRAIAIDGEGVTLEDGSHVYRYMAACTSDGELIAEIDRENGITTREALDFVASLYVDDMLGIFGYGLGYDQCKWLEDLPNKQLFDLFHAEDLKPKAKCGPYQLNMLGRCLQITNKKALSGRKRVVVWDILKAFQSTFVNALRTWNVGNAKTWQRIEDMKKKRGDFANQSWDDVKKYCREECRELAALVEKYVAAHCDAGIDLRGKFHGAGSTGDAFLRLMDADGKRCSYDMEESLLWRDLKSAWSRAFFGGRSEISRLGFVSGTSPAESDGLPAKSFLHTYDIGSAYPHALYDMPCLKHGKWERAPNPEPRAKLACIRWSIAPPGGEMGDDVSRAAPGGEMGDRGLLSGEDWQKINLRSEVLALKASPTRGAWGPLPYRTSKSAIVFPTSGPGGWVWAKEFDVAQKNWPGVRAREAWCFRGRCSCEPPWKAIGDYYLKRLEWGKEGPGLVLKLGLNSCYGKFAQTIGKNPRYACRVVAGVITSTTRARILEAIASWKSELGSEKSERLTCAHPVVYVATDGIVTDRPIHPPDPPVNETKPGAERKGKVMLGGWEHEEHDDEYFLVQPGWYFSTDLTKPTTGDVTRKDRAKAKTRGMPLDSLERDKIMDQWRRAPLEPPRGLPKRSVFRGVKQSILPPTKDRKTYARKASYGRWEEEERELKYVVNPKRSHPEALSPEPRAVSKDAGSGLRAQGSSYLLWTWSIAMDQPISAEYKKDPGHGEARQFIDDQPDFVEVAGTNVGE